MKPLLTIVNDGQSIELTNYFETDHARKGLVLCSVNAGTIRVLIPQAIDSVLPDLLMGRECVLSRGPWPAMGLADAVEIMWDDGSDNPFALHLNKGAFDVLPAEPPPDREWTCSVWIKEDGAIQMVQAMPCRWRRVPKIPWMKAWNPKE